MKHGADSCSELPDPHTTQTRASEVHASVVAEWPPVCLHKLLPRGHQGATEENLEWKDMHMKFETEISKQTWVTLPKPCRLQSPETQKNLIWPQGSHLDNEVTQNQ